MDDLISRAAALDAIDSMKPMQGNMEQLAMKALCWAAIKTIQPVDAVPVVHGRWINYPECLGYEGAYCDENIVCSECHSVWNIIDNDADRFDYCPECGAKMDGERRNSE